MKKIVKVFSVMFLVNVIFCSCFINSFAAEDSQKEKQVLKIQESTAKDEAVSALFSLGILDAESYDANSNVTRGEFIGKTMHLKGIDNQIRPVDTVFSDVKKDNVYSGAVAAAYDMGVINGYSDGTFRPDELISKVQAVKIMVSVLGYDVHAISYGGYPTGYLTVASREGLLKNIKSGEETFTWNEAAWLIYNATDVDVLQCRVYPETKYEIVSGENPMTLWMHIYLYEGKISANDITSITKPDGVKNGFIEIDKELFKVGDTKAGKFLGRTVKAYYKIDDAGEKCLVRVRESHTSSEIFVAADAVSDKTTLNSFYWYESDNGTLSAMNINEDTIIVCNGKYCSRSDLTLKMLMPQIGGVTLIDADNNKTADIVYIESSQIYVVKEASPTGYIKDMYGQPDLRIDLADDAVVRISKDGNDIRLSDITPKSVLTVTESIDKKYLSIKVSNNKIKGTIEEKNSDYVIINGKRYDIVNSSLNRSKINDVDLNITTTFYLAADDKIAGFDERKTNLEYGYLIVGEYPVAGLDANRTAKMRIFTRQNAVNEFTVSDKVTVNGEKHSPVSALTSLAVKDISKPEGNTKRCTVYCNQLVKYSLDNNGEISSVETASDNLAGNPAGSGQYKDCFSLDYSKHGTRTDYKYFGFIAGRYIVSNSWGLRIPYNDPNKEDIWDDFYNGNVSLNTIEKSIASFSPMETWDSSYKLMDVDIYDVDENAGCGVIIEGIAGGAATPGIALFLVEKAVKAIDDEGSPTIKVTGLYNGKEVSYTLPEVLSVNGEKDNAKGDTPNLFASGDVWRISADDVLGQITSGYKIFALDKKRAEAEGFLFNSEEYNSIANSASESTGCMWKDYFKHDQDSNWDMDHLLVHGKCTKNIGETLFVDLGYREGHEGSPQATRILRQKNANNNGYIYVYDEKSGKTRLGSYEDIDFLDPKQTAVFRVRHYESYDVILINREKEPGEIYWNGSFD